MGLRLFGPMLVMAWCCVTSLPALGGPGVRPGLPDTNPCTGSLHNRRP